MFRSLIAALLVLLAARCEASELGGRLLGVLLPLQPGQALTFTVSPDGRTVYAVTTWYPRPEHPTGETTLHVIGVSDPTAPHPLSAVHLGDFAVQDMTARGTRLFLLARAKSPNASVVVIDVHDQLAPAVIGRVEVDGYELNVARDGFCFGIGSAGSSADALGSYSVNPTGNPEPGPCTGLQPAHPFGGKEVVYDRRGASSLLWIAGRGLFIREAAGSNTVEHGVYVPPGTVLQDAQFLAALENLVALARTAATPSFPGRLVALNGGVLPFDADRLMATQNALMQEYERRLASDSDGPDPDTCDRLASQLGAAGATEALSKNPPSLSKTDRVTILNNLGFWQSRGKKPADAIPTLQLVVELAPGRAVAWRNLGDAARASLSGALTGPERARLTKIALGAYETYRTLKGHDEPDMADFASLNALNAPRNNVCALTAAYYSHGRQREISGVTNPADVDGNGSIRNIDVQFGGSLVIPYVHVTGRDGGAVSSEPAFGLDSTEANAGAMNNIAFIPFDGAVYAVIETGGAPTALHDWAGHQVCHFTAHYTASVSQSLDDGVCKDVLAGPLVSIPPTTEFPQAKPMSIAVESGVSFWVDMNGEGVNGILETDLSGSGRTDRVGFFEGYHPHGDCHSAGVVLMDGDQPQSSARNTALLKAEWDLIDCRDAGASVVRDRGHTYVEIDSGLLRHNEKASRTVLRITKTGAETVCRVVEKPTYTAVPN